MVLYFTCVVESCPGVCSREYQRCDNTTYYRKSWENLSFWKLSYHLKHTYPSEKLVTWNFKIPRIGELSVNPYRGGGLGNGFFKVSVAKFYWKEISWTERLGLGLGLELGLELGLLDNSQTSTHWRYHECTCHYLLEMNSLSFLLYWYTTRKYFK